MHSLMTFSEVQLCNCTNNRLFMSTTPERDCFAIGKMSACLQRPSFGGNDNLIQLIHSQHTSRKKDSTDIGTEERKKFKQHNRGPLSYQA